MREDPLVWIRQAEPGWRMLEMPRRFGEGRSFVSGETESDRVKVYYFYAEEEKCLYAKVWFGIGAEGPPGHVHGGALAATLDEAMGFACWVSGFPVLAKRIEVFFRRKVPLRKGYTVRAWVERPSQALPAQEGDTKRREELAVFATLMEPHTGRVLTEANGTFAVIGLEHFGEHIASLMMGRKKHT